MGSSPSFRRLGEKQVSGGDVLDVSLESLTLLLNRSVVEPFSRVSPLSVFVRPLVCCGPDASADSLATCHPSCVDSHDNPQCRETCRRQLAEVRRSLEAYWHKCDCDRYCAQVPVVHEGECVAALAVVASGTYTDEEFESSVEILDALARKFVTEKISFLNGLLQAEQTKRLASASSDHSLGRHINLLSGHPLVIRALQYMEEHLSESSLSVASVGKALRVNSHYLGSLFVEHTGQRMSRYITLRRIELGKRFLATTNWQVKRIAVEAGFANAARFCHRFNEITGLTPRQYRKTHSDQRSFVESPPN